MVTVELLHLLPPRAAKFKRFIKRRAEQEQNEQQSREKRNTNLGGGQWAKSKKLRRKYSRISSIPQKLTLNSYLFGD